jgi:hypothetical protein
MSQTATTTSIPPPSSTLTSTTTASVSTFTSTTTFTRPPPTSTGTPSLFPRMISSATTRMRMRRVWSQLRIVLWQCGLCLLLEEPSFCSRSVVGVGNARTGLIRSGML